jgi:hypothetical protein
MPVEDFQEHTETEPVQPAEPQREVAGVDDNEAENAYEPESTPATPVESAHTTPSPEPRRQQVEEEYCPSDVDYDE